jgi:hypothetical protein
LAGAKTAGSLSRVASAENFEEALLELGRDRDVREGAGGADGAAVGVHEGHAGLAAFDVEVDELAEVRGEAAVDVVAEELGDLPALQFGRAA